MRKLCWENVKTVQANAGQCHPHLRDTSTPWLLSKLTNLRVWFNPIKIPTDSLWNLKS